MASVRQVLGVVVMVAVCLLAGGWPPALGQPLSAEQFGLGLISEERTRAEDAVRQLRERFPAASAEYAEGRRLYTEAQAAFNRYIDRLKFALILGEDLSRPEVGSEYRRALDAAAARNHEFLAHVARVTDQAPRGIVGDIASALVQAGLEIWKEWRRQGQDQRTRLVEALEALKFRPFTEVP